MEKKFYEVKFTESAEKDLKKLNKSNKAIAKLLKKWISENLIGTQNPKQRGKEADASFKIIKYISKYLKNMNLISL